jgi:hypothetical protein
LNAVVVFASSSLALLIVTIALVREVRLRRAAGDRGRAGPRSAAPHTLSQPPMASGLPISRRPMDPDSARSAGEARHWTPSANGSRPRC